MRKFKQVWSAGQVDMVFFEKIPKVAGMGGTLAPGGREV